MTAVSGRNLTVFCCAEGGSPYVDGFNACATSEWSTSESGNNCRRFQFRFLDQQCYANFLQTARCRCKTETAGSTCEELPDLAAAGSSGSGAGSSSFKMSLLLAVIPLSFAVFAAVGGFLCKITPCCFCFDIVKWPAAGNGGDDDENGRKRCPSFFGRKKPTNENDDLDNEAPPYDEEYYAARGRTAATGTPHGGDDLLLQVDVHSVELMPIVDYDLDSLPSNRNFRELGLVDFAAPVADPPAFRSTNCPSADHAQCCANCSRKYSPPPAYSEVCRDEQLTATALRTTATQT